MEVVIGKRQLSDLGKRVNDHATRGGITGFAKRFMEKHGWKEGQGLGKNKDGMTEHIKIKQREDNAGLGIEEHERKSVTENWWFGSFEQALSSFKNIGAIDDGDKKTKKKRKSKTKETKTEVVASTMWGSAEGGIEVPSYEELFKATGGKRLGMRARASQKGKWARTEHMTQVTSSADGSTVTTTSTAQEVKYRTGSTASASSSALASVAATMVESDTSSDEVVAVVQAAVCGGKKRKKDKPKRSRGCEGMEGDGVAVAGGEAAGCGTVAVEALQEDGDDGDACSGLDGAEMKREKKRRKKERKSREVEVEQEAVVAVHEDEDDLGEDDGVKPEKRKSKKKRKRRQESEE